MKKTGVHPEVAGNSSTEAESKRARVARRIAIAVVFLAFSFVDVIICMIAFFALSNSGTDSAVGLLSAGVVIGFAHAVVAFLFFRTLLAEVTAMIAVVGAMALWIEKTEEGGMLGWYFFKGFGTCGISGVVFFVTAVGVLHLFGFMKKPRIKPNTFESLFVAVLLVLPARCFWDTAIPLGTFIVGSSFDSAQVAWHLANGVFIGASCAMVWNLSLRRRDADYWLEYVCLLAMATVLSYVYAWLGYLRIGGDFPGLSQLIGGAVFAALAIPLSLRHKRKKSQAKAVAAAWLDERIAAMGSVGDYPSDAGGGQGSPAPTDGADSAAPATAPSAEALAALKDSLAGARWLARARYLKAADTAGMAELCMDLGGNVAKDGAFWFCPPGTGKEQVFVLAEGDWDRLVGLAGTRAET